VGEDTPEGGASKRRGHPGAWILLGLTVLANALLALATAQASPAPCGAGFPFCSSDRENAEILWFLVDLVIALIWLGWGVVALVRRRRRAASAED
jgi:hypothetical protein